MEAYEGISYFGGAGRPVKRLGDIAKKQIIPLYGDSLNVANITELDRKKVEAFLKCGSKDDVSYFVEEYLKSICKENCIRALCSNSGD